MNYSPKGLKVWDTWYMPVDDVVHVYHLQRRREEDGSISDEVHNSLGHAVTRDLIEWEQRSPAFGPNPADPLDDGQPWTGCAVWHEGTAYLYYTMRGSANGAKIQRIGLATSSDCDHFERHPAGAVIVPDKRWYCDVNRPVPGIVDCRDLVVVPDPAGGWLGYYASRTAEGDELPETSCTACVHSDDLIRWEHLPPAFAPRKYACIEVPDVFELNGLWYMTNLTGNYYGNRGLWSEPGLVGGTMFAVSDDPRGPFEELSDNILVAAREANILSSRSVMFEGQRYLFYTDQERTGCVDSGGTTVGTITTPKVLRTSGDRLYAAYSNRIEKRIAEERIGPSSPPRLKPRERVWGQIWGAPCAKWEMGDVITGVARTGWGALPLDADVESFIFEANVTIEDAAAAGLLFRMEDSSAWRESGMVVVLDAEQQVVEFAEVPNFDYTERRWQAVPTGKAMHLRLVVRLEHVEVYVDDELRIATTRYRAPGQGLGLFVDRGTARFRDVRLRTLNVDRPE